MAQRADEQLASGLASIVVMAYVVIAIVAIWLAIKATELVIRVMVAHPTNRPMWVMLGLALITSAAVLVDGGKNQILLATAVAAIGGLLITAKVVEVYYDQMLQPELSRQAIVHQVLNEPWWNAA